MFNVDMTSLQLNKSKPKQAYVTLAACRALKKRCQSVSVTKKIPKYRCIKLMTLINAQGDLIATVAVLKDSNIQETALWKVIMQQDVHSLLAYQNHLSASLPNEADGQRDNVYY